MTLLPDITGREVFVVFSGPFPGTTFVGVYAFLEEAKEKVKEVVADGLPGWILETFIGGDQ
jgi:hypothetical protein